MAEAAAPWQRHLREPGLWVQLLEKPAPSPRPALFLDRDGTINVDIGYPGRAGDIVLIETIVPAIRMANDMDMPVVVVTNQSGVGRGYFGWDGFAAANGRVLDLLAGRGCHAAGVFACAYHADGVAPYDVADHDMRKPRPGMLLLAAELLRLDLSRSIMAGDKQDDVEAGRRAGCALSLRLAPDDIAPLLAAIRQYG